MHAAATQQADLAQLHALEAAFAAAVNHKDADAAMRVYAPGEALFVFDVVGPPGVYESWNAYHEALQRFFASFEGPLHFSIDDLHVTASGDVAYGRSLQHVRGVRAKDGKALDYTVRVTNVYRKFDGNWRIVQEHVSLQLDRATFTPILHPPN